MSYPTGSLGTPASQPGNLSPGTASRTSSASTGTVTRSANAYVALSVSPLGVSQLGVSQSQLGAGVFDLGRPPITGPAPTIRQASAFVATKFMTPARVTEVVVDATIQPPPPGAQITEVIAEAAIKPPPPPVNVTEVIAEAAIKTSPPPVNVTELVVEAVVFAPPTRLANASVTLVSVRTRTGKALLRASHPLVEKERNATARVRLRWPYVSGGAPLPDPTVAPTVTIVHGTGNTLPAGTYKVAYTWIDPFGQTHVSPTTTVTLIDIAGIQAVTPALPPGATGVHVYITDPGGSVLRDSGPKLEPSAVPATVIVATPPGVDALTTPALNTTGYTEDKLDHDFRYDDTNSYGTKGWKAAHLRSQVIVVRSGEADVNTVPPFVSGNPEYGYQPQNPLTTRQAPSADVGGKPWYDIDYVPTISSAEDGWRHPLGGFPVPTPGSNQVHGLAFYDPPWRALPSAAVLSDELLVGNSSLEGKHLYIRHVWTQPPGAVQEDGLLTLRVNGIVDHIYVNGVSLLNAHTVPRYWSTWERVVPASTFRTGKNVLAIECHPASLDAGDPAPTLGRPVSASVGPGGIVHVDTGDPFVSNTKVLDDEPLLNSKFVARRPDNTSRQFWNSATFTATGQGFSGADKGPGFWGYYGYAHNPQYWMDATWDGQGITPDGSRRIMWGHGWSWPPVEGGFPAGDVFTQSNDGTINPQPISFKIGETRLKAYVDRWNMISVGRIGGGGSTQLTSVATTSSDEWAPGAAYLLSYPITGAGNGTTERTLFSDSVYTDLSYPVDAEPWIGGRTVAVVAVNNLREVFVSVVSKNPTIANLGKARMWVNWLDENGQIGGTLASDNEFLHATFGRQPATLWPYSENMFWIASNFGTGAWQSAKAIQIVMFRHQDTPNQYNQWLVNVTVREKAVTAIRRKFAQWV